METIGKDRLAKLAKDVLNQQAVNVSGRQIRLALDAIFDAIAKQLQDGFEVQIMDFGTFFSRMREEREGRNISTGASFTIPRMRTVAFRPARALKDAMNDE